MTATSPFSSSYAQARARFLEAAEAAGLDVHSHRHPMLGRDGETLGMDVACQGDPNAQALLLITSGCHGIEGFAGSGVQLALLRDPAWQQAVRDAGVAVLYVHALNPYGFSWWRRTTHENVDLNRNFHDFNRPLPANPGYDELAALLVPPTWPPSDEVNAALARVLIEQGLPALQAIVSGGQHEHPQGLFYGGRNPCWSQVTLRHVLREHAGRCARLGWIDLHTGLGESGVGERIFSCRDDAAALQRARAWWGEAVTSLYDGSSSSAPLTGQMWSAIYEECPQAEYTGIALEYGTVPIMGVIQALRADQWLENHPEADAVTRDAIKRGMFEAFFTDTPHWQQRVLAQAFEATGQALGGLR